MIIKKLILKGYKRLFLNNINYIEYTPKSNIEIILGSNGSGKSSLLNMLSPLPVNLNRDFSEDGYKHIEIEHHNKEYVLSSGVVGKNKHSFVLDKEELNPGGTKKVQLELVYTHFKITVNINNILLGRDKLTTMSLVVRKHWFSELSTVDYSFSISVYNRLKQRHRDIVGGIKLLQEDLLKIETMVTEETLLVKLIKNREYIEKYIDYILTLYDHKVNTTAVSDGVDKLKEAMSKVYRSLEAMDGDGVTGLSVSGLTDRRLIIVNNQIHVNNKIEDIVSKIEELDKLMVVVSDEGSLFNKKKDILNNLNEISVDNYIGLDIENIAVINNSFEYDYTDMVDAISALSEYTEIDIGKHAEKINMVELNKKQVALFNSRIDRCKIELDSILSYKKENNLVKCGDCGNSWYFNYDEAKVTELKRELNKSVNGLTEASKQLSICEKELNEIMIKKNVIENIKNMTLNRGELRPVWRYLFSKHNILTDSSASIITTLYSVKTTINNLIKHKELKEELSKVESSLEMILHSKKIKMDISKNAMTELNNELANLSILKTKLHNDLIKTDEWITKITRLKNNRDALLYTLTNLKKNMKSSIGVVRNKYLSELVSILKSDMVKIDQTISTAKQHKDKINTTKTKLLDYLEKEKVLKLIVKDLSPSEGLIAKSINSFLNIFIDEMNHIINSVWSYEMVILPCGVSENNDLDYKFKVFVNNDETIDDVSDLSTSMQEIVDLAFKLVFIKYMGIHDAPLILDEFAVSMDPKHRINAFNVIDSIFSHSFSQTYIVSHFSSMYGRFKNADIIILDSSNLEVGDMHYNNVIKIL